MKKNNYLLGFLVLSIVLVSGCVDLGGVFGSDVINVQQTTIPNSERNPLVIKSATTLPTGTALPSQDVKLIMILQNKDDLKTAYNVFVDLFNPSIFKCVDQVDWVPTKTHICITENQKFSRALPNELLPGEDTQVVFSLKSPSEAEIAGIKQTTSLDYKVSYDFESSLSYIVPVVDMQEIIARQQANEKVTVQISKSYSSGPVQIDVELQGAPYILDSQKSVLLFKIKNVGTGTLKNSSIRSVVKPGNELTKVTELTPDFWKNLAARIGAIFKGQLPQGINVGAEPGQQPIQQGLVIKFPEDIIVEFWPGKGTSNELFTCDESTNTCINIGDIPIFRDESRVSMRFEIRSKLPEGVPFRSYPIVATVGYTYEVRNSISTTVNPYQNV